MLIPIIVFCLGLLIGYVIGCTLCACKLKDEDVTLNASVGIPILK